MPPGWRHFPQRPPPGDRAGDAAVRPAETLAQGMIAVPISPEMRMAVVGSPAYFEKRPKPRKPQELTAHNGVNLMPAETWRALHLGI